VYTEYFRLLATQLAARAEIVSFEGYDVYLASGPRMFATELGNMLREKKPPLALISSSESDGTIRVSIRSNKEVDASALARKYGGNGHPGSAAFSIPPKGEMPWKLLGTK
jgi:hypothetical protein